MWGLACDPWTLCEFSVLWLHRHIWKCSWIEQCLNDGWKKGGNKTFSPVWCFRDLLLSEKCCACLISEDVLHSHHHSYSLGNWNACKMGGKKRVPWEYSQADIYKVKKPQFRALQQSCFEDVASSLYNLWVNENDDTYMWTKSPSWNFCL